MNPNTQKVITRFAPSPTGFLHIGGVRTALFSYLWARKQGGTFILRIEDTDKEREVAGSIAHIQESLKWLGIEWDFGPDNAGPFGSCIQSERLDLYKKYAEKLVAQGDAYPDPYTEEELQKFREAAEAEKRPFLFRNHRPETFDAWDGKKPLRFKVPNIKRWHWNDVVRGPLEAGEEALDDFILIKGDGYPTYNFAHIVDDIEMGVTHVMRGEEFISSSPKFLSLYEALGVTPPMYATMPVILGPDGNKKLSKRDGAKDILEYRTEGYLPAAMVNFLALIGWNPGGEQELFSRSELIAHFEISRIQSHGGAFNEEKLRWMNREHVKLLPKEAQLALVKEWGGEKLANPAILSLIMERVTVLSDIKTIVETGEFDYFFAAPSIEKISLKTPEFLAAVIPLLESIPENNFTAESVKAAVWDHATKEGRGNVLWPMRVALSGREKSPDPFIIAALLGKEETLRRIQHASTLE